MWLQGALPGCPIPIPRQLWAWLVVVVVVVVGLPPAEANWDMRHLQATVRSHTQTLVNMERYLRQTDRFWKWYQQNHRRLDELMADGLKTKSLETGGAGEAQVQELHRRLDDMQNKFEKRLQQQESEVRSLQRALGEQRGITDRLQSDLQNATGRLRAEEITSARLRDELRRNQEAVSGSEAAVGLLNEKVGAGSLDDVLMFVKNMAKQVNRSLEDLHAEVRELRDQQVARLSAEVATLNATAQSSVDVEGLEQQVEWLEQQVVRLEQQVDRGTDMNHDLDERITLLDQSIDQAAEDSTTLKEDIMKVVRNVTRVEEVVHEDDDVLRRVSVEVEELHHVTGNLSENLEALVTTVIFPMEDQINLNNQSSQQRLESLAEV